MSTVPKVPEVYELKDAPGKPNQDILNLRTPGRNKLHEAMSKRVMRLCYRKVIDVSSQKPWDRYVWESTYQEFLMQVQFYNQEKKFATFAELIYHVPAAGKLHFLVSASVAGYIRQLNGIVPGILNNLGKHFLRFNDYGFEIINSDISNKAIHQVAVSFISDEMVWHDTIGDHLLLSPITAKKNNGEVLTDLVQLQPFLGIYSLENKER